jgi:hypothetical protein
LYLRQIFEVILALRGNFAPAGIDRVLAVPPSADSVEDHRYHAERFEAGQLTIVLDLSFVICHLSLVIGYLNDN